MHGPAPRASGCGYAAPRGWPRAADALSHADGLALRMHGSLPRAPNRVHGHPKGLALWRYGPHTEGLELRMHGSLPRASSFSVRARPAGRRCKRVPRLVDQQLLRTEPMRPGLPPTPRAWRCGGTGPTPKASSCGCMAPYRGPRATCTAIPPRVWRCGGTGPTPKASSCGCMAPYRGPRASVCELVRLDGGPNRATRLVDQQLLRTEPMRPGLPPTPRAWRCGGTGPTSKVSSFRCPWLPTEVLELQCASSSGWTAVQEGASASQSTVAANRTNASGVAPHTEGLALRRYGPHTGGLQIRMPGFRPGASSCSVRARPGRRRSK
ncbi:hypothetical protein J2Z79_001633 [Symbiobacterium terraclitae]|uniref:Uncharacterized protein n=1 Tax=Symbiobacterium terraclitae TaxID=557451 RepID=A0ABS4JRS8_9FIRM|nr:hypothetical protein [Symbiobacterium terraclitae]